MKKYKGFVMIEVMFAVLFISSSFIIIFGLLNTLINITQKSAELSNLINKKEIFYSINDPILRENTIINFPKRFISFELTENKSAFFSKYNGIKNINLKNNFTNKGEFLQIIYDYSLLEEKPPEKK